MTTERLPIYELEGSLVGRLRAGKRRIVLQAPTGSGKSTQVPQMLLDAGLLGGDGRAVVLQPRRLPARMLAARVSAERGQGRVGDEVGYRIRLDNVTSRRTRIEYVTEGILLRQMLNDRPLPGVAAILFDEFHERHLYGDITLARALQIQETTRPDLVLVVHVGDAGNRRVGTLSLAVRNAGFARADVSGRRRIPPPPRSVRPRSALGTRRRGTGAARPCPSRRRRADLHARRIRDQPYS